MNNYALAIYYAIIQKGMSSKAYDKIFQILHDFTQLALLDKRT